MALDRGPLLLARARGAIAEELGLRPPPAGSAPWLLEPGATFVTLHLQGALRGCVGTLEAWRPLGEDVAANACAAAFHDARFAPLARSEFPGIDLEVSLLSALDPIPCRDQDDLLDRLRPGVDGLVLAWGGRRSVFLPQVWEQLPNPAEFLAHLKLKAGWSRTFWDEDLLAARFSVAAFREPHPAGSRS
jgi:hypothetical protein